MMISGKGDTGHPAMSVSSAPSLAGMLIRGSCAAFIAAAANLLFAQTLPLNHPAIGYGSVPLSDPVTRLSRSIEQGKVRLDFDPITGYLPAALKALGIPVESQMAVFSKTSVQAMRH